MTRVVVVLVALLGLSVGWALVTLSLFEALHIGTGNDRSGIGVAYDASAASRALLYSGISLICTRLLVARSAIIVAFLFVFVIESLHAEHALFGLTNSLPHWSTSLTFAMFSGLLGSACARLNAYHDTEQLDLRRLLIAIAVSGVVGYFFALFNAMAGERFVGENSGVSDIGRFLLVNQLICLTAALVIGTTVGYFVQSIRLRALVAFVISVLWLSYMSPSFAVYTLGMWNGGVLVLVTAVVAAAASVFFNQRQST